MKLLIPLILIGVYALHQDLWNWTNRSLVGGVLPAGLAYHAFYSVLAALTMLFLVKTAWPRHLEAEIEALPEHQKHQGAHE